MTETKESSSNSNTKIAGAVVAALIGVPTAVGLFGGSAGDGDTGGSTGAQVAVLDTEAEAKAAEAAKKAEEEATALAEAEAAKKAEEEAAAMAEAEEAKKAEEEAAAMAEAEAAKKAEDEAAAMAEAEAAKKAEEESAAMAEAEAAKKAEEEAAAMAEAEAAKKAEEEAAMKAEAEAAEQAEADSTETAAVTYTAPTKPVTYQAPAKPEGSDSTETASTNPVTYTAPAKKAAPQIAGGWEIAGFDGLSAGTSYADARAMLIETGWSPRDLTEETRLDSLDENEQGLVDSGFAELEGCETYARTVCRFEFLDGEGKIAAVLTAGKGTPSVIDAFVMDIR